MRLLHCRHSCLGLLHCVLLSVSPGNHFLKSSCTAAWKRGRPFAELSEVLTDTVRKCSLIRASDLQRRASVLRGTLRSCRHSVALKEGQVQLEEHFIHLVEKQDLTLGQSPGDNNFRWRLLYLLFSLSCVLKQNLQGLPWLIDMCGSAVPSHEARGHISSPSKCLSAPIHMHRCALRRQGEPDLKQIDPLNLRRCQSRHRYRCKTFTPAQQARA